VRANPVRGRHPGGYRARVHVFLTAPRLVLRRFTTADTDLLYALDNDPEVMRYINGGRPVPGAEISDDILPAFLGWYARFDGYGSWAAHAGTGGDFIGWFHLCPPPGHPDDEPEPIIIVLQLPLRPDILYRARTPLQPLTCSFAGGPVTRPGGTR